MEDYAGAHVARSQDVDVLLTSTPPRSTAAAHIGGVAVECRLKAIAVDYHRLANWNDRSGHPKDPRRRTLIPRPGHGLLPTLKIIDAVYRRAKADKLMLEHLSRVMHPNGATAADFIDLRYASTELAPASLAAWRESLRYVLGWLQKNAKVTL